jgi:hypothetical protein
MEVFLTEKQKAGPGSGCPQPCLPLHQPSIFPGYLCKRFNGFQLPENSKKSFLMSKPPAYGDDTSTRVMEFSIRV